MEKIGIVMTLSVLLAGAAGCSSNACELALKNVSPDAVICTQYDEPLDQSSCEDIGGTRVSSCPTDDVIGRCESSDGSSTAFSYANDGAEWAALAKKLCLEGRGIWTDG